MKIIDALKSIPWAQAGITANEIALKITNGYKGEKIDTNTLNPSASANGVAI
ncbi:hypothetical protein [uncultured Caulobacter sp.]|uniref:hypothetical protein n=1 Tax=uncultured Caulobacter sp. TaxID=158749 RepID=UPI002623F67E|nr:hypothetical protein [uncultured Caulobacter sp.]